MKRKKVALGMSGGVDSSVAAAILLNRGYDVIGITMNVCMDSCYLMDQNVKDARIVADKLGIKHYVVDFRDIFKKRVIDYFTNEYIRGRTPNPCVACNKYIKFDAMLEKAFSLNADYIATGHYARIEYDNILDKYLLKKAATKTKDQTYVLYNLSQTQLKHIIFPLGDYTKLEIRDIAKKLELPIASKPESQEICFIKDNNYINFIKETTEYKPSEGFFVDTKGNVLGKHKGVINYTIGQRKGLGISFGKPMYVVDIDAENDTVILGESGEEYSSALIAENINFIVFDKLMSEMEVASKIRYTGKEAKCIIRPYENNKVMVEFDEPQRAVTPGQSVVFYNGDILIGGGIIKTKIN